MLSVSLTDSCGMARRHKVGNSACQAQWWEFDLQFLDALWSMNIFNMYTFISVLNLLNLYLNEYLKLPLLRNLLRKIMGNWKMILLATSF